MNMIAFRKLLTRMNKVSGTSQFFSSVGAVSFGFPMISSKGAKTHVALTLIMLISSLEASNASEQVFKLF